MYRRVTTAMDRWISRPINYLNLLSLIFVQLLLSYVWPNQNAQTIEINGLTPGAEDKTKIPSVIIHLVGIAEVIL
jgi:hypothetical protein